MRLPSILLSLLSAVPLTSAPKLHFPHDISDYSILGSNSLSALSSLSNANIDDLNVLQAKGIISSVDLVNAYINRIWEVNGKLRAVSETNPDALKIAEERDVERAEGLVRGPLHGIPILVKDSIATIDELNTTAGSYALLGARPRYEATVVRKLRNAGAIILGKATMGEWAQFRSSMMTSSHGWSALGGQTLGAYYPLQDPHGSSSGSAVAVSVGLAAGSLATETSGSIVNPAERNNIVGIKPTLGLTSRNMVIPISIRQDSVGPMAQTVKDAAYILSAISGRDQFDEWTSTQPFEEVPDYTRACKHKALKGARLGIPRNGISLFLSDTTAPIMAAFDDALRIIKNAGADIQDNTDFATFDEPAFSRNSGIVLDTDFSSGLADYLSKLASNPNDVHTLDDLIRFTKCHPGEGVTDHDVYVWERAVARNFTSTSEESQIAYDSNVRMAEDQGVIGGLDRYHLDALIMPTFTSFYLPAIAGLPVITVPLGFYPPGMPVRMNTKRTMFNVAPGIPFGLAFIGRKWSEETLISLAYAFEQRTKVHKARPPYIRPAFEFDHQVQPLESSSDKSESGQVTYDRPIKAQHPERLKDWILDRMGLKRKTDSQLLR